MCDQQDNNISVGKVLTYAFWLGSIPFSRLIANEKFVANHFETWKAVVLRSISYCHIIFIVISAMNLFICKANISRILADDFFKRTITQFVIFRWFAWLHYSALLPSQTGGLVVRIQTTLWLIRV